MSNNADSKSEKFSVSFPIYLLNALDKHVGPVPRSRFLQDLTEKELRAAGALPTDDVAHELKRLKELIDSVGIEAVKAKLDELVRSETEVLAEGPR